MYVFWRICATREGLALSPLAAAADRLEEKCGATVSGKSAGWAISTVFDAVLPKYHKYDTEVKTIKLNDILHLGLSLGLA